MTTFTWESIRLIITTSAIEAYLQHRAQSGTTTPEYFLVANTTTGMYLKSFGVFGLASGGVDNIEIRDPSTTDESVISLDDGAITPNPWYPDY